jgi:hypothetical protein
VRAVDFMQSQVERDRQEVWRDSPLYIYLGPDHAWATASSNLTEADRGRVMKVLQVSAAWSCDKLGPPSPAQCIDTPSDADMTDGADSRSSTVADGGQSCRIQHCFPMACRGADAGFCQVCIAIHRFHSEVDCRPGRSQPLDIYHAVHSVTVLFNEGESETIASHSRGEGMTRLWLCDKQQHDDHMTLKI